MWVLPKGIGKTRNRKHQNRQFFDVFFIYFDERFGDLVPVRGTASVLEGVDEMLHVDYNADNKKIYYSEIVRSIIDIDIADEFICALCELIQNLTISLLLLLLVILGDGLQLMFSPSILYEPQWNQTW